jgi:heme-degrading monooxygenase HmoA
MTFHAESEDLARLVNALRSEVPAAYESLPGFRGMVVLDHADTIHHVLAVTLWKDEESITASSPFAATFVDRIARATRSIAACDVYEVIGTLGIYRHR